MKIENYGVQEMDFKTLKETNGGRLKWLKYLMDVAGITAAVDELVDGLKEGFIEAATDDFNPLGEK